MRASTLSLTIIFIQRTIADLDQIKIESYISAHVILVLFNQLGKSDKCEAYRAILSLFCNEFNKFNDTRARILDSIYHMTLRILEISFLA